MDRGPARALHLLGPRARPGAARAGRLRRRRPHPRPRRHVPARPRRLHAVRDHRADHHLHPAARAVQARAPTGWSSPPCTPTPCIVTPYRGAGRPQGVFCMERTMDRIAGLPGQGPHRGARGELHPAGRVPLRPGADVPGRAPADLRQRRTTPRRCACSRSSSAGTSSPSEGASAPRPRAAGSASGSAATSRAPASGRTRAGTCRSTSDGRVHVSTGLTSQGQGHQTVFAQIAATELGVPIERVSVVTGDTRRFGYAVGTFASRAAVMSGNAIALACRKVREKALRIAADALEADPGDLTITDGSRARQGQPVGVDPAVHGRGAGEPAAVRLRRGGEARHPVRRPRPRTTSRRSRRGRSPAWRAATTTRRCGRRSRPACTRRSWRPTRRPPRSRCCGTRSCTTAGG